MFLEGEVTLEVKVVSELQCWDHCMRQKDCKAYNYYHAIGQSFKTCQLLSNDEGLPIFQVGCTYHIINEKKKNIEVSSDFSVPWKPDFTIADLTMFLILRYPGKKLSLSKLYGAESRLNNIRFNDNPVIRIESSNPSIKFFPVTTI